MQIKAQGRNVANILKFSKFYYKNEKIYKYIDDIQSLYKFVKLSKYLEKDTTFETFPYSHQRYFFLNDENRNDHKYPTVTYFNAISTYTNNKYLK